MAERQSRLNKPVSDDILYAAGVSRDIPEKEPPPPPPLTLPDDLNPTSLGIEYRAMDGIIRIPPEQYRPDDTAQTANDKRFAWLRRKS